MLEEKVFGVPVIIYILATAFAGINFLMNTLPTLMTLNQVENKVTVVKYIPEASASAEMNPTASPSAAVVPTVFNTRSFVTPKVSAVKSR